MVAFRTNTLGAAFPIILPNVDLSALNGLNPFNPDHDVGSGILILSSPNNFVQFHFIPENVPINADLPRNNLPAEVLKNFPVRIASTILRCNGQDRLENTLYLLKSNSERNGNVLASFPVGNADDKFTKNYRKTLGLLRDLKNSPSVGVIKEIPEKGLVEIARPVGVVGAVTPSTNPIATPLNNTLNAIKGRNSIILAPENSISCQQGGNP